MAFASIRCLYLKTHQNVPEIPNTDLTNRISCTFNIELIALEITGNGYKWLWVSIRLYMSETVKKGLERAKEYFRLIDNLWKMLEMASPEKFTLDTSVMCTVQRSVAAALALKILGRSTSLGIPFLNEVVLLSRHQLRATWHTVFFNEFFDNCLLVEKNIMTTWKLLSIKKIE